LFKDRGITALINEFVLPFSPLSADPGLTASPTCSCLVNNMRAALSMMLDWSHVLTLVAHTQLDLWLVRRRRPVLAHLFRLRASALNPLASSLLPS